MSKQSLYELQEYIALTKNMTLKAQYLFRRGYPYNNAIIFWGEFKQNVCTDGSLQQGKRCRDVLRIHIFLLSILLSFNN